MDTLERLQKLGYVGKVYIFDMKGFEDAKTDEEARKFVVTEQEAIDNINEALAYRKKVYGF